MVSTRKNPWHGWFWCSARVVFSRSSPPLSEWTCKPELERTLRSTPVIAALGRSRSFQGGWGPPINIGPVGGSMFRADVSAWKPSSFGNMPGNCASWSVSESLPDEESVSELFGPLNFWGRKTRLQHPLLTSDLPSPLPHCDVPPIFCMVRTIEEITLINSIVGTSSGGPKQTLPANMLSQLFPYLPFLTFVASTFWVSDMQFSHVNLFHHPIIDLRDRCWLRGTSGVNVGLQKSSCGEKLVCAFNWLFNTHVTYGINRIQSLEDCCNMPCNVPWLGKSYFDP